MKRLRSAFALLPLLLLLIWLCLHWSSEYPPHTTFLAIHLPRDWKQTGIDKRKGEHTYVLETRSGTHGRVELEALNSPYAPDAALYLRRLEDLRERAEVQHAHVRCGSFACALFPNADPKSSDLQARVVIDAAGVLYQGRFLGAPGRWSEVLEMLETSAMVQLGNSPFAEELPEIFGISFCYVLMNVGAYLFIFPIGCAACYFFKGAGRVNFRGRVRRFSLLLGVLLVVGMGFNVLWTEFVYLHLYYSTDYTSDFVPYLPFGQEVLDAEFGTAVGGLLSAASLREVQAVWCIFAASTWVVTIWCYRRAVAILRSSRRSLLPAGAVATC